MTHKGKTVEFCTTIQLDSQSILTRSTLLHRQECPGNSLWAPIKESKFRNGGARQEPTSPGNAKSACWVQASSVSPRFQASPAQSCGASYIGRGKMLTVTLIINVMIMIMIMCTSIVCRSLLLFAISRLLLSTTIAHIG